MQYQEKSWTPQQPDSSSSVSTETTAAVGFEKSKETESAFHHYRPKLEVKGVWAGGNVTCDMSNGRETFGIVDSFAWGEILSVYRTCHLELSFFLCQACHVTLLFQVKTGNPPLLFCLLIYHFISSVSIKPMTTVLVFLQGVCVCVCGCVWVCGVFVWVCGVFVCVACAFWNECACLLL